MSTRMASTRLRGAIGEDRAAEYLTRMGWRIRERNFRTRTGEIDIIAEKGDQLAFVEVKAWDAFPPDDLEYAVCGRKRRRILSTARSYLSKSPECADRNMRFDVIFLRNGASEVMHIEGAFDGGMGW